MNPPLRKASLENKDGAILSIMQNISQLGDFSLLSCNVTGNSSYETLEMSTIYH